MRMADHRGSGWLRNRRDFGLKRDYIVDRNVCGFGWPLSAHGDRRYLDPAVGPSCNRPDRTYPERNAVLVVPWSRTLSESEPVSSEEQATPAAKPEAARSGSERLPIKMLNDRILVQLEGPDGERKSTGGILIPATAQVGKRLTWAEVVAAGPSVRSMEVGDRVLFNPEDRYEVEVGGHDYIILRERDIHAVAAERLDDSHTGLYL